VFNLRIVTLALSCFMVAGTCDVVAPVGVGRLTLDWNVPVTEAAGSLLNWYEMKSDPEDSDNLIVCGTKRDAQNNAYYGVVYASHDGGKSWNKALEDRSSSWVTEHSCAFGHRHVAYFVSEASKVVDGEAHHALGTTRVFVSSDGGGTWSETAKTGWADFSTSVVAPRSDGQGEQLYVFYNGDSQYNFAKQIGSTLDFFTVSEDGKNVSDRQTVPGMVERDYQGVYPSSSVVLNDGSPIVLYAARKESTTANGLVPIEIGVVRITSRGASAPIIVAAPVVGTEPPACPPSLSDPLAYDRAHDALYVAYNDVVAGHCALSLATSRDGGLTWSSPHELSIDGESHDSRYFPILAVNRDGVIGVLWRGKREFSPDCWYFSISKDGSRLDDTVILSPCVNIYSLEDQSSGYLAAVIRQPKAGQSASVELVTFRDYQSRVGITATPDGVFHPLWSTLGDGFGELRTARIQINDRPQPLVAESVPPVPLSDVTDKITVLYGGEQRLDRQTKSVIFDISFRNDSSIPIQGPLYLEIKNARSDFGNIELMNPLPHGSQVPEYLKMSSCLDGALLGPSTTTSPCHFVFHFTKENPPKGNRFLIVGMKLRVFCRRRS
jgi:hypothetical protein